MLLVQPDSRDPAGRFGPYLRELLALEGFAAIETTSEADLAARLAHPTDCLVLPRAQLPAAVSDAVVSWVRGGGHLVVLHPDNYLLRKLGLWPGFTQTVNGVLTGRDQGLLAGLPLDPVQVIVPVVHISAGADLETSVLATATDPAEPFNHVPAIWEARVGKGEVVVFAFDLAHAVARLRHGDPDLADMPGMIYDHISRPSDLFRGQLDPRQAAVPQADILCAILGRVVESLAPQPRLWYFPKADQRSVLIQTSDDDWSTIDQFETMLGVLRNYDATCTFYIVEKSQLTTDHMDRWEQDGHIFSVHPSSKIDIEHRPATLEPQRHWVPQMVRDNVARHQAQYGRPVTTIRNHAIRWVGYMELAYLHAELGIRGEANYFTLRVFPAGYLTGSGRLARFVDADGTIIDHLQIASHWTEEILVSDSHGFSERWLYSRAQDATNGIIRNSASRYHTPTVINSHPVSFATYSRPLIESNWQTARECGIPITAAEPWVAFTDARREVTLSEAGNGFDVHTPVAIPELTVLVPGDAEITGDSLVSGDETIWGRAYTAVTLTNLGAGETRHIGVAQA